MTVVVEPPIVRECQMSKRKPATASKRVRRRKIGARAQRTKQAIVKSQKNNPMRAVAAGPTESLHDDPKQDAPIVENRTTVLQDEFSRMISASGSRKRSDFSLAMAYVQAYQAKLLEMAQANMQFAFEFAQRLSAIRSPFEILAVIVEFTSKRIDMFQNYLKDMAELNTRQLTI
jgi:hypothetical protein